MTQEQTQKVGKHVLDLRLTNPKSRARVGRRLAMAMAGAGLSNRGMAEALGEYGISLSHETIRRVIIGARPLDVEELEAATAILDPYVRDELPCDTMEWLRRGPYDSPTLAPDPSRDMGP